MNYWEIIADRLSKAGWRSRLYLSEGPTILGCGRRASQAGQVSCRSVLPHLIPPAILH
jgi:hypothetical protein